MSLRTSRPVPAPLKDQIGGARRQVPAVGHVQVAARVSRDLRHQGQLEAGHLELLGVPALPHHPSRAAEAVALHDRRQRPADVDLAGRPHGATARNRDDEPRRQAASRVAAGSGRRAAAPRLLLRAAAEPVAQPASRLRDDAPAVAEGGRPDRDLVRMALSSARVRASRFRPRRRDRLLGRHQPRGLARVGVVAGRHRLARLPPRFFSPREGLLWEFDQIVRARLG